MKTKIFISKRTVLLATALVLGLGGASGAAKAAPSCYYSDGRSTGTRPVTGTMPWLAANISVGRDVPVGSVVYQQTMNYPVMYYDCTPGTEPGTLDFWHERHFSRLPLPLSPWQPTNAYAGKVYQTDIAGLGISFYADGKVLPDMSYYGQCKATYTACYVKTDGFGSLGFVLFKTGDVSPGSLSGVNLPVVRAAIRIGDVVNVPVAEMGISGNLNIVSRTCSTPNVTVSMGTHKVSAFKSVNTGTVWKDFSIALSNCPAFYGLYGFGNGPVGTLSGGVNPSSSNKLTSAGTMSASTVYLRIDSLGNAIDPAKGLLGLDPEAQGKLASATGVGVQIAGPDGTPIVLAQARATGLTLWNSSASYSIPLRARYLQTAAKITPGPANASATFTLIYQ